MNYEKLIKFIKSYEDEEMTIDYWYDVAADEGIKIISSFSKDDWRKLEKSLEYQSTEFKKKLIDCFVDEENEYEFKLLVSMLLNSKDEDIYIASMDALRGFVKSDRVDFLKRRIHEKNLQITLDNFGVIEQRIIKDFLYHLKRRPIT